MVQPWHHCRYDRAERGRVEWISFVCDITTWTCYHHARQHADGMRVNGWVRVTQEEWLDEPSLLVEAR